MNQSVFVNVLEDIFDVPRGSLTTTDTRDSVENWTSIADVQILTAISAEFGLEPDVDLLQAESVGALLTALQTKGAFSA